MMILWLGIVEMNLRNIGYSAQDSVEYSVFLSAQNPIYHSIRYSVWDSIQRSVVLPIWDSVWYSVQVYDRSSIRRQYEST
jgi:hypothetical protein